MSSNASKQQFNRRSTVAALTGASLGMALAATRPAGAQETDLANHPVIGTWAVEFEPAKPSHLFLLITFHAEGSMIWSHPFGGIGIGVWKAADDRSVDTMVRFQNIADSAGAFVPGTVTSWSKFTVEDDDTLSERAVVEIRSSDGTVVAIFPHEPEQPFTRLSVEPPPPLDAPEATPA